MASVNVGNTHLETPLARDGSSKYTLTFDEFQNALGDPGANFGSMNMDDLIKNIWTAEESQAMAAAINSLDNYNGGLSTQISLQKQGSLSLLRTLSTKTVEEVWKSVHPQLEKSTSAGATGGQQRQTTLGEVTLEDFLVKAGIVKERPPSNPDSLSFDGNGGFTGQVNDARYHTFDNDKRQMGLNMLPQVMPAAGGKVHSGPFSMERMQPDGPQTMLSPMHMPGAQGDWMVSPYKKALSQKQQHATERLLQAPAMVEDAPSYSNTSILKNGALTETSPRCLTPVARVLGKGGRDMSFGGGVSFNKFDYGAGSPLSPCPDETSAGTAQFGMIGQRGRKRFAEGPVEKVIQRRQCRMIKNRESASRSRARKQAYTLELEAEVSQLKEENMKLLRKQEDDAELRRKQMIVAVMPSSVTKAGCSLKRTNTGPG